jgi:hypothetical protein
LWLLSIGAAAGQSEELPQLSLAEIAMLREQSAHSPETWLAYISFAEVVIEKAMRERPGIVAQAAASNGRTERVATKSPDLAALDAAIGRWIADKTPPAQLEISLAEAQVETTLGELRPAAALMDERERKQRVVAEVIMVIAELFSDRLRDIQINKGKSDKLGPSAVNALPRYAGTRSPSPDLSR